MKNQVTHASSTCCKKITFYSQKIKRTLGIQSWEATGFAVRLFPFSFVLKARCLRGQSTLRSLRYSRSNLGQNFNELFFHLFLVLPQISKASTMPLSFSFGTFSDQHMWSKTCAILRTPSVNFVSKNGQYLTQKVKAFVSHKNRLRESELRNTIRNGLKIPSICNALFCTFFCRFLCLDAFLWSV